MRFRSRSRVRKRPIPINAPIAISEMEFRSSCSSVRLTRPEKFPFGNVYSGVVEKFGSVLAASKLPLACSKVGGCTPRCFTKGRFRRHGESKALLERMDRAATTRARSEQGCGWRQAQGIRRALAPTYVEEVVIETQPIESDRGHKVDRRQMIVVDVENAEV